MSFPNQLPPSLRHLKTRLQPFRQPVFWASTFGISLVLFLAWEYWNNPQVFSNLWRNQSTSFSYQTAEPAPSAEDLAAQSADLDSSSVLLKDLNSSELSGENSANKKSQGEKSEGFFERLIRQEFETGSQQAQKSSALVANSGTTPSATNLFATSAQELLNTSPFSGIGLSASRPATTVGSGSSVGGVIPNPSLGVNLLNSGNPNGGAVPGNPLEQTVNRVTATNSPATANRAQLPVNAQGQTSGNPTYSSYQGPVNYPPMTVPGATGYNPAPTTATTSPNPYSYSLPPQSVPVVPMTPVPVGQYSVPPLGQTNGVPNPGLNPTSVNPGLQQSQLSRPLFRNR